MLNNCQIVRGGGGGGMNWSANVEQVLSSFFDNWNINILFLYLIFMVYRLFHSRSATFFIVFAFPTGR